MRRSGTIAVHLAAWPMAIAILALVARFVGTDGPLVEVRLSDTYFVLSHWHGSLLPLACLTTATAAAMTTSSFNRILASAWAAFAVHLAMCLLWFSDAAATNIVGAAYLASAIAVLGTTALGWAWSLFRALTRSPLAA